MGYWKLCTVGTKNVYRKTNLLIVHAAFTLLNCYEGHHWQWGPDLVSHIIKTTIRSESTHSPSQQKSACKIMYTDSWDLSECPNSEFHYKKHNQMPWLILKTLQRFIQNKWCSLTVLKFFCYIMPIQTVLWWFKT